MVHVFIYQIYLVFLLSKSAVPLFLDASPGATPTGPVVPDRVDNRPKMMTAWAADKIPEERFVDG